MPRAHAIYFRATRATALVRLLQGESAASVGRRLGVPRSTVRNWWRQLPGELGCDDAERDLLRAVLSGQTDLDDLTAEDRQRWFAAKQRVAAAAERAEARARAGDQRPRRQGRRRTDVAAAGEAVAE